MYYIVLKNPSKRAHSKDWCTWHGARSAGSYRDGDLNCLILIVTIKNNTVV